MTTVETDREDETTTVKRLDERMRAEDLLHVDGHVDSSECVAQQIVLEVMEVSIHERTAFRLGDS